ncbi:cytochrome c3 family protein [Shewanella woodyi]|uniref:cytochrome c3 family protein n=1 Tax=Shewanella woodyi TaxID=60961 RepID=UPI0007F90B4E|nr:cytochrome c3 family protein [Shewanella woodyi]
MSSLFKYSVFLLLSVFSLVLMLSVSTNLIAAELNINKSKECIKCHKRNGMMRGVHGNDALDIRCQDCHGEKQGHPRQASNLIGFSDSSAVKPRTQVQACLQCHDHFRLFEHDWSHAVHSDKVNCASCHQLHSTTDPMVDLLATKRSQLCSRCHSVEK